MNSQLIKTIKGLVLGLLFLPVVAMASGGVLHLDKAPVSRDPAALQHGAKLFVNYCMGCHGASFMRYNMLHGIGLDDEQIKTNLMFAEGKVGDQMKIAMRPADAKEWFGATPPDLTLIARQRASEYGSGADWIYTYLRQFYRDPERPTGWNNLLFENVGMPNPLWQLQGHQVAHFEKDEHGVEHASLKLESPGQMSVEEYDKAMADLVSFLVWMGEPVAEKRNNIGIVVLLYLVGMFGLSYLLKKNFWKDVH